MAVAGSFWLGRRLLRENGGFALQNIEIQPESRLSREQILAWAEIPDSANLLRINPAEIRDRLAKQAYFRTVRVKRRFPHTLTIELEERRAVARLAEAEFVVDAAGVLIPAEPFRPELAQLPVIVAPNQPPEPSTLRSAARFVKIWPNDQRNLLEIRLLSPYSFQAEFEGGLKATFGVTNLERQISDLKLILKHANSSNQQLAAVNLLMKRNIPVKFAPTVAPNNSPPTELRPVSGPVSR